MDNKKKSLFSQKIKEARKNQPKCEDSFPKAMTVDLQTSIVQPPNVTPDMIKT